MNIRQETLELISKEFGQVYTGLEICNLLKKAGIPNDWIVYPETKWKIIFGVFDYLSSAEDKETNDRIYKLIENFVHPLNLRGNDELSIELIKKINRWLVYDNVVIDYRDNLINCHEVQILSGDDIDELYNREFSEGINIIQKSKSQELILLKKYYQLLIDIVNTYFDNTSKPEEKLNEFYIKIVKNIRSLIQIIFKETKDKKILFSTEVENPCIPFNNLFGAESEYEKGIDSLVKGDVRRTMNKYLGEIIDLCLECDVGNITSEIESQKLFNDISLYLSEIKKENDDKKENLINCGELALDIDNAKLKYKNGKEIIIQLGTKPIRLLKYLMENDRFVPFLELAENLNVGDLKNAQNNVDVSKEVADIKKDLLEIIKNTDFPVDKLSGIVEVQNKYGYKLKR